MRLRPSMRENYRYLLTRIVSSGTFEAKEIYLAASDAYCSLFGEIRSSHTWIAVMEHSAPYTIFRFRRGNEKRIDAALTCVTSIKGVLSAIHPVKTSGTIKTLREEIHKRKRSSIRIGTVKMKEGWFPAEFFPAGRIDLKEKGINLKIPLYITEEDIEDLYYDE